MVDEPRGSFADVPAHADRAGAIEGILSAGVTRGCSTDPLSHCPDCPVTRAQMASFLVRALALQPDVRRHGDGVRVTMARANRASGESLVTYAWAPSGCAATLLPGRHMVWLGVEQVLDDSNPLGRLNGETWDQRPGTGHVPPRQCPYAVARGTCRLGWQVSNIRVTARNEFFDANPAAARIFRLVRLDQPDISYQIAAQGTGAEVGHLVARWMDDHRVLADI